MRFLTFLGAMLMGLALSAQDPDRIVGMYFTEHQGEVSKIKIFRTTDGLYNAQVVWVKGVSDAGGEIPKDLKNPDKAKRDVPCDQIVLIEGLRYNDNKNSWGDTKIYDPTRGIRANVNCSFDNDSTLRIRGQIMGIGETVYWKKID